MSEFMDESALSAFDASDEVLYAPDLVDDPAALLLAVADANALIVRNRTQVNAVLLDAAPDLKVVGRLGVGLDNIDLDACKARGIAVRPAIGANARSVAEYVLAASLLLLRGAFGSNEAMIAGEWPRSKLMGCEAGGRTMALWGFGGIAQAVAEHAMAVDMAIFAFDPYLGSDDPAWAKVRRCESSDELLDRADVLSLHVPLTEETRGMINAAALAQMKEGAILINTARGGIVDEAALSAALRSGALGGAALDVFACEPLTSESAEAYKDVPNLILTPHIAGVTQEGDVRVSALTVSNVLRELKDA